MCTSLTYSTKDHYFGRNLDLNLSYGESVTITPRHFPFEFRKVKAVPHHYALIGMAVVVDNYPLYFDATNEKGLSMAGLNFPDNAYFFSAVEGKDNVSPFEFIPWILGQCASITDAKKLLANLNLVNINFSEDLPLSPLHWIIADQTQSIVVESVAEGLQIYDNPVGVLTNNPPFDYHLLNLTNYRHLSTTTPANTFSSQLELGIHSLGMGGLGLPGDLSSPSRFVRAAFAKSNSVAGDSEAESVGQFFHLLKSVAYAKGLCEADEGKFEYTIYSSCCNVDKGIYYYTTYENSQITAVQMNNEDLDGAQLTAYPLVNKEQINIIN
ncbi:choloylglycine hydrolase [Planococcus faecalis]|uniref:choloylglycine hydrolase n=1 Tax=Planococcus faecalis TaxID=1598147 RepID=A0ABN4XHP9_9BACL|nr:choloylglycine hydrolase [Planococcus faecalis]AQU79263.1 choloylglycine hydrolase [Planococcus faecalis]